MLFGNVNQLSLIPYVSEDIRGWIKNAIEISNNHTNGKFPIGNKGVFVVLAEGKTELLENRQAEIHKKYVDIQILLNGNETIGYSNHLDAKLKSLNDIDNDVMFFSTVENEQYVNLSKGDFALFYPDQLHRPLCATCESMLVRKAIVKVPIECLQTK
ncbi:YhcH/YjgK/YiaL family protein [Thaumasiovibrio sp. DFM-14]|uniref:YhcH/YjgK/YiaL family protein n=1 Tax=Thaumasiovibrio sp. DFM-14 TaxID=3384792 RepID=UPI0039A0DF97